MTDRTASTTPAAPTPGPAQGPAAPRGVHPAADLSADPAGIPASLPATDPLAPYDAVLLLSYGGPCQPEDVLPFMRNATAGRGVPDSRLLEVSGHYQGFGGASPINARNAELRDALQARLAERGSRLKVVVGNRNWHPFVSQALRELADAGARHVLALPTAAFGSYSGCRQYREDLAGAVALLAAGADGATGDGFEADAAARVGGRQAGRDAGRIGAEVSGRVGAARGGRSLGGAGGRRGGRCGRSPVSHENLLWSQGPRRVRGPGGRPPRGPPGRRGGP